MGFNLGFKGLNTGTEESHSSVNEYYS